MSLLYEQVEVKNRYILIVYPGDINQGLFTPNARDNITEPFLLLRERCHELGYVLKRADRQALSECAVLLFWDASSIRYGTGVKGLYRRLRYGDDARDWLSEAHRAGLADRVRLILWEPLSVHAKALDISIFNEFPVVLTWNDELVDGKRFYKFCYPIPAHVPVVEKIDFAKKKLLVNISQNKFSVYPHELYSARRDAIRYFERKRPEDFDLYGVGWDRPIIWFGSRWRRFGLRSVSKSYTSYRGTVKHKWEVLPRYRFSLCYENCSDQPGYITEKIFDCMRADCVPIYWGAPNVTDYVDSDTFIDRRQFKSNEDLEEYICSIDKHQFEEFREAIKSYLESDKFKRFLSNTWVNVILKALNLI